jgi:hypothetical protein
MDYVNRPNTLTANAGHHVPVNTNIRKIWASGRLEGHIGEEKYVGLGGREGRCSIHRDSWPSQMSMKM